jgi:C-terminal processing protease CtpA/Prc
MLPICGPSFEWQPLRNAAGPIAYDKPMLVLTDELTISFGDYFSAAIQDNARAPLFGMRTNGAGGSVSGGATGFYSETFTSFTVTLGRRQRFITTPDFGTTNLIENAGVRPDIPFDYMTRENLLSGGRVFTDAFTRAILDQINRQ